MKFFLTFFLAAVFASTQAQQQVNAFLESYGTTGIQEQFYKNSVLRSTDGHTYVCGATLNANGNYDLLLTKLTSSNVVVWSVTHAGSAGGDDYGADLIQDTAGNIIVTGTEYISATNYNAVTIKYNSNGILQWISHFNGPANSYDGGISIVRDGTNNIYVCGSSFGVSTLSDYLCVKYSSTGVQMWATTWNSANLQDVSVRLALSGSVVSVSGGAQQTATKWLMATVTFNANTGVVGASQFSGGSANGLDKVGDLAIDASDNSYVVGSVKNTSSGYDLRVMKMNASLTTLWQQTFNGLDNLDDEGLSLELTSTNDVVVSGFTTTLSEGRNFIVRKYSGSNGTLLWSKTFDGDKGADEASALKLDASGNAIVCGSSFKNGNLDFLVQKLRGNNGNLLWEGRWNSDNNSDDVPMNVAIDEDDNTIYVAGQSKMSNGQFKYVVTRWSQKEVFIPRPAEGFSSCGGYIINRGQLRNPNGTANASVKYYSQKHSPSTYIDKTKVSYQFSSITQDSTDTDAICRVDMSFQKGFVSAPIYPLKERYEYSNFYLGHMVSKAERTNSYDAIVKIGAYTNTDVLFTTTNSGYRHWIVAKTGAPVNDFEMAYTGQSSLSINGAGDLVIETSLGQHIQPKAKVYTMNTTTGALTQLSWQPNYTVVGNKVSFNYTGTWTGVLVIELQSGQAPQAPAVVVGNLDWSTYIGGTGHDETWDVTSDENEHAWITGEQSIELFAETSGLTQVFGAFASQEDMYIAKFDQLCRLDYITLYGGSNSDRGYSIVHDELGQVYAVGYTQSNNLFNFINQGSLNDGTLNGAADGVFLKLGVNGDLLMDSYIGGNGIDVCQGVAYHHNVGVSEPDIWICGFGDNTTNFPLVNTGGYNQAHAGGKDGFIMRLSGDDQNLVWSTWFGSEDDDFISDIAVVRGDPVFVGVTEATAFTSSTTCGAPGDGLFPKCDNNGGDWQHDAWSDPNFQASNHFIGRFRSSDQSLRWSSFLCAAQPYIVSENKPTITAFSSISIEDPSPIFVSGTIPSAGSQDFEIRNSTIAGAYNQSNFGGGASDAFLARFNSFETLTDLRWSTFIGGENDEGGYGLGIDQNQRMFLTGWTISSDMQNESDWCTVPNDGTFPLCDNSDLNYMESDELSGFRQRTFIMAFNRFDKLLWSSQFGDGPFNRGKSVAIGENKLFLAGWSDESWTLHDFNPTSSTDYYQPYLGQLRDGSIARFDIPTILGVHVNEEIAKSEDIDLIVYPNPAQNKLSIILGEKLEDDCRIEIYDYLGQLVVERNISLSDVTSDIDISSLSAGFYQLVIVSKNKLATCSFIKS